MTNNTLEISDTLVTWYLLISEFQFWQYGRIITTVIFISSLSIMFC